MEEKPDNIPNSNPEYSEINFELGKEILDRCSDDTVSPHLTTILNLPQVDGALYRIYYANYMDGYIKSDVVGNTISMHPHTLQSIMQACCAIGVYTQDSISRADKLWEIPVKEEKTKCHYCLYCKTSSVTDITERICDNCKKEIGE